MIRRLAGLAVTGSFTGCIVLTCSSCAILQPAGQPADGLSQSAQPPAKQRLAQFHFGRDAAFGVCAEPACPQVTTKTLAVAAALTVPVVLRESQPQTLPSVPVPDAPPPPSLPERRDTAASSAADDIPTHRVVVNFPFASAALTSATRATLTASIGRARRSEKIIISGRTDVVGDIATNEALALSRALAVRNYFRDVAPDLAATIAIDAKGRCCFVASNADEGGRSKNRRVEIVFTSRGGA
jgi:outer membrane protein OmpA-like peptidoglycan-associated protein